MVSIPLDPEESGWEKTALRCLRAGATLYGVPGEKLETLSGLAEEHGLELTRTETPDGWRVIPSASDSSSSHPDPPSPPPRGGELTRADDARPGSDAHSPTEMTDLP